MPSTDERTIEFNKTRILLYVAGCCALEAIALWLLTIDSAMIQSLPDPFNDSLTVRIVAIFCVAGFGIVIAVYVRLLFIGKPGLIFSPAGIADNSSAVSVAWHDITGFGVYEIYNQKMLVVKVADPDKYIEVGNPLKRMLMRNAYKRYGGSLAISPGSLKISFSELQRTADEYFRKYGKSAKSASMQN